MTIAFKNYSFQYFSQAEPTLHEINIEIKSGEKILIIGPSGSGKSTLGHCLNGLIPHSYQGQIQGSLEVAGLSPSDVPLHELSKSIGTVMQDTDAQFVGLTVGEDIAFAMENDLISSEKMHENVAKVAKMVDMETLLEMAPSELSGGQKQRTALAGIMIDDVDILLFDEPLANLDPLTGKGAIEIIDDIHRKTGKTILIIEHRLEDVLHRAVDRIILVNEGRIIADNSPDELLAGSLLRKHGIREPLYITALKYAGITLQGEILSSPDKLNMSKFKTPLQNWSLAQPEPKAKAKNSPLLEVKHLDFSYNSKRQILSDISFTINKGELIAVAGKNGTGKSTMAKLICGFEHPDKGEILLKGQNLTNLTIKERAEQIGFVMQNPNQMISKGKIFDEVALGLVLRGFDEDEITKRVKKALNICGLRPFLDWPVSALSYGQKKRVTIASILVLEPEILILDEPTAGQDYHHYSEIMAFLTELNALGITIIMITHDMHLMLEYASRCLVFADKKMIADASAANILTDGKMVKQANLAETSLYKLAKLAEIEDGTRFVQQFINVEKKHSLLAAQNKPEVI